MNDRLSQFLLAENISQSQFADTIGVAKASISHIIAGRNKPGYDFICRMMEHYPSLNVEWLLSGKGKMYKGLTKQKSVETELPEIPPVEKDADLFTPVENPLPKENTAEPEAGSISGAIPSKTSETSPNSAEMLRQLSETKRVVTKIIIFYNDNSFQELSL